MITMVPRFFLGLDIGSTAIKAVVVDASSGAPIWDAYTRHESRPGAMLLEVLRRVEQETPVGPGNCQAFATGSAAGALAPLIGARDVQEVAATVLAVERRHPDARTIVELGGHDAKIVIFEEDGGHTRKIVSMNDKCAGGTGAVIDKITAKLKIPPASLADLAYSGQSLYPIAGKCGVFAETDINSLQKRGVGSADLMASLFEAIVLQNLAVLARGHVLPPRVLLLGGPHAFIPGLCDAWRTHIGRIWRERGLPADPASLDQMVIAPPFAAHLGAIGAIEQGRMEPDVLSDYTGAARLAAESPDPTAVLRERVTSKGGTTEAALASMAVDQVKEAIIRAIHKANERGRELGEQLDKD